MLPPYPVESLEGRAKVICIGGRNYHSFAVADKGGCIAWGQCDFTSLATNLADMPPENFFFDARGKSRILTATTRMPYSANAVFFITGSDQTLLVTKHARSTIGFVASSVEPGRVLLTIEEATIIGRSSTSSKKSVWVDCRGHYSILPEEMGAMASGIHRGTWLGTIHRR